MAVRRMVAAGAVPITWIAFASELQRDWARLETVPGLAGIMVEHMGNVGTSLTWEAQLLTTPVEEQPPRGAAKSERRELAEVS